VENPNLYDSYMLVYYILVLAIQVSFNHSAYEVNENSTQAQPVLVLSNPSSTDITVRVSTSNGSALGMYPYPLLVSGHCI